MIAVTKKDLLAPANFVTLAGFVLTIWGSLHLATLAGVVCLAIGRALDLLDGPVARRTHTSRFGAVLDASIDKFAVLAIVTGLLGYNLAPPIIVLYILLQNGISSVFTTLASRRHIIISTSQSGKLNIFFQMVTMLLFASMNQVGHPWSTLLETSAYVALGISLYYAIDATKGYAGMLHDGDRNKTHNSVKPQHKV